MGDSYDGGETNDSTESSGNAESTDSGDDSSAFYGGDIGEKGTGDMEDSASGEENEYIGEIPESTVPESTYGDGQDGFDMELSEQMETNEPDDGRDDENDYEGGDVITDTPDEVSQDIPEELESELPNEMEVDRDGDEESAYEDESDEAQKDMEIIIEQDLEDEVHEPEKFNEEELKVLQEQVDNASWEYNHKYSPYDRAISKGVEGVTETPNGGVSFENSDALYVTEAGRKGVVIIEATGSRSADFDKANEVLGLDEKPDGYTWHHLDNYNVKDNTVTLELVRDDVHNSVKPHSGGCAQYDAVYGPTYNPPRQ